jgi:hypothetical protein
MRVISGPLLDIVSNRPSFTVKRLISPIWRVKKNRSVSAAEMAV